MVLIIVIMVIIMVIISGLIMVIITLITIMAIITAIAYTTGYSRNGYRQYVVIAVVAIAENDVYYVVPMLIMVLGIVVIRICANDCNSENDGSTKVTPMVSNGCNML